MDFPRDVEVHHIVADQILADKPTVVGKIRPAGQNS